MSDSSRKKYFCHKKGFCHHQSWNGKCRTRDESCPDCKVVDYSKKLHVWRTVESLPKVVALDAGSLDYPFGFEEEEKQ